MFDSLKKKIASWLGKSEEKSVIEKKKEEVKEVLDEIKGKPKKKSGKKEQKEIVKLEEIEKIAEKEKNLIGKVEAEETKKEPSKEAIKEIDKEIVKEEEKAEKLIEEVEKEAQVAKPSFLSKLFNKISAIKLSQEQFDEIFAELEIILLENNVALEVVDKIKENLAKEIIGRTMKKTDIESTITESLKDSISKVLIEPPSLTEKIKEKKGIYTILFFGINGSGKTTSIAKLAHKLKKQNISCVMAAADTFRAASIEQLQKHGDKIGINVISHDYGADPAAVAFDAKKYAESNNIKVVLIDTAGRMYTKQNLLKEMEKIVRISQPDLKIFVGEAITGNDAIEQAKTFNETIGIDGIILSKADVDEKSGTILSVSQVTGKPIYFLGTGQGYDSLTNFTKESVIKNLGLK